MSSEYFVDGVNESVASVNVAGDDWSTLHGSQLLVTQWKLHTSTSPVHHITALKLNAFCIALRCCMLSVIVINSSSSSLSSLCSTITAGTAAVAVTHADSMCVCVYVQGGPKKACLFLQ